MFYIAVFRSRTETIMFTNLLKSYGISVAVINTPRRLNVACGISAKFPASFLPKAKEILSRRRFDTFAGIWEDK